MVWMDPKLKNELIPNYFFFTELARNGGKVCESFQHENCTHVVVDDSKTPNIPSEVFTVSETFGFGEIRIKQNSC